MLNKRCERLSAPIRACRPLKFLFRKVKHPVHGTLQLTLCGAECFRLFLHSNRRVVVFQAKPVQTIQTPNPVQPSFFPQRKCVIASCRLNELATDMRPTPRERQVVTANARKFFVG